MKHCCLFGAFDIFSKFLMILVIVNGSFFSKDEVEVKKYVEGYSEKSCNAIKKVEKIGSSLPTSQDKYLEGRKVTLSFQAGNSGSLANASSALGNYFANGRSGDDIPPLNCVSPDLQDKGVNGVFLYFVKKDHDDCNNDLKLSQPYWTDDNGNELGLQRGGNLYWPRSVPIIGINVEPVAGIDEDGKACYKYIYSDGTELPIKAYEFQDKDVTTGVFKKSFKYVYMMPYVVRSWEAYSSNQIEEEQSGKVFIKAYGGYDSIDYIDLNIRGKEMKSYLNLVGTDETLAGVIGLSPDLKKFCYIRRRGVSTNGGEGVFELIAKNRDGSNENVLLSVDGFISKLERPYIEDAGPQQSIIARFSPDGKKIAIVAETSELKSVDETERVTITEIRHNPKIYIIDLANKTRTEIALEGYKRGSRYYGVKSLKDGEIDERMSYSIDWKNDSSGIVYAVNSKKVKYVDNTYKYEPWVCKISDRIVTIKASIYDSAQGLLHSETEEYHTGSYNAGDYTQFAVEQDYSASMKMIEYADPKVLNPGKYAFSRNTRTKWEDYSINDKQKTKVMYSLGASRPLLEIPAPSQCPEWSPNGDYLGYISFGTILTSGSLFFRKCVDGSEHQLVKGLKQRFNHKWSSDGKKMFFGGWEIYNIKDVFSAWQNGKNIRREMVPLLCSPESYYSPDDNNQYTGFASMVGSGFELGICTPDPYQILKNGETLTVIGTVGTLNCLGTEGWKLRCIKRDYTKAKIANDDQEWILIASGKTEKYEEPLGTWNTGGLSNGSYILELIAVDKNNKTEYTRISVRIKNTRLTATIKEFQDQYIVPNSNTYDIKFNLNDEAWVTILIKNSLGKTVSTLAYDDLYPQGDNKVSWWGTVAGGYLEGNFKIEFTATDITGEKSIVTKDNYLICFSSPNWPGPSDTAFVDIVSSNRKIALRWAQAAHGKNPVDGYKIYRSKDKPDENIFDDYKTYKSKDQPAEKKVDSFYLIASVNRETKEYFDSDSALIPGNRYYYKVTAFDTEQLEGYRSHTISEVLTVEAKSIGIYNGKIRVVYGETIDKITVVLDLNERILSTVQYAVDNTNTWINYSEGIDLSTLASGMHTINTRLLDKNGVPVLTFASFQLRLAN